MEEDIFSAHSQERIILQGILDSHPGTKQRENHIRETKMSNKCGKIFIAYSYNGKADFFKN